MRARVDLAPSSAGEMHRISERASHALEKKRVIPERAWRAGAKRGHDFSAHGVRKQNEATISARMACWSKTRPQFRRAWRAEAKRGKFLARMACGSKTGQVFGAHGMRKQNEGHFGRAWRAEAKRGHDFGAHGVRRGKWESFWTLHGMQQAKPTHFSC
ncbi:hypothetical protein BHU11_08335 [Tannerella sp. oral taxon 808]|nr:hypothetical protein BHU11_08335 [Tannerella sp. oral taxon 808]